MASQTTFPAASKRTILLTKESPYVTSPETSRRSNYVDDLNLALLKIAYPQFRFSYCLQGQKLRWVAVRRDGTDEMGSIVTADLDELQAVLDQAVPTLRVPLDKVAEVMSHGLALGCEQIDHSA